VRRRYYAVWERVKRARYGSLKSRFGSTGPRAILRSATDTMSGSCRWTPQPSVVRAPVDADERRFDFERPATAVHLVANMMEYRVALQRQGENIVPVHQVSGLAPGAIDTGLP
jgi:hypothetical protein